MIAQPPNSLSEAVHPPSLIEALRYLTQVIQARLASYFKQEIPYLRLEDIPRPAPNGVRSAYTDFLRAHDLSFEEHVIMLLALAPHLQPDFFDEAISPALPQAGDFPQIGGVRGKQFRGFLPTGETALFILAGPA